MPVSDYDQTIDAAAREWNVDPHLLRAVMHQESGGKLGVVSRAGARGLMQVMPDTGKEMGATNLDDPEQNIYAGAKYLSQMLDRYKRPDHALIAYNAGPQRADAFVSGKGALPAETLAYVPAVAAHYGRFKGTQTAANGPQSAATMSDDDFLKSLDAPKGQGAAGMSDDDFLKSIGAGPPAPPEPGAPVPTPTGDMGGDNVMAPPGPAPKPTEIAPGLADAAKRVGEAAISPFTEGSAVQQWVNRAPTELPGIFGDNMMGATNRLILQGAALPAQALELVGKGVQGVARGVGALAGQGYTNVTGDEGMGGRLARDIGVLPDAVFPALGMMAPKPNPLVGGPLQIGELGQNALANIRQSTRLGDLVDIYQQKVKTGEWTQAQADAASAIALKRREAMGPNAAPPPENPLVARTDAPTAPESVGAAATPGDLTGLTRREAKAYAASANGQKLLETQEPGRVDATEYVPGTVVTRAEQTQDAALARQEAALERDPQGRQIKEAIRSQNNQAIDAKFDQVAGNPVTTERAARELGDRFEAQRTAVLKGASPVDASGIISAAEAIKASPEGMRGAVETAVNGVLSRLDRIDPASASPEMLYGLRKHINDLLEKNGPIENKAAQQASRELLQLKGVIDDAIEAGAPGFKQLMADYAREKGPLDAQTFLQAEKKKLVDAQGMFTHAKYQGFMRRLVDAIDGRVLTGAEHLTPEQMAELWAIRDHLRRQEAAFRLGRGRGESNTVTGLMDAAGNIATQTARLGAHALAAASPAPGIGNMLVEGAFAGLKNRSANKKMKRALDELYNPPPLRPRQD